MMNTPDKAILDLAIEENFNRTHMGLQGGKLPWKNQQFKDKDQSFDQQGSLFGCKKDKKFKPELQKESRRNIPSRIDPSLFVTAFPRFLRYGHLGFCAKIDPCTKD